MDPILPPTERAGVGAEGWLDRVGPSVPGRIANEVGVAPEVVDEAALKRARIRALELLLAASRRREEELTANVVRGSEVISDLYGQLADMAGSLARAGAAESMLTDAERRAAAAERRADMLATDLRLRVGEVTELTQQTRSLERDLSAVTAELAEAASAHTRLIGVERDLETARATADERRAQETAAQLTVAEAEAKVATLRGELDALTGRLVIGTTESPPSGQGPIIDLRDVDPDPNGGPQVP